MKYYVISKFYNDGRTTAYILAEAEYNKKALPTNRKSYDLYVDAFDTWDEAVAFCEETRNA